MTRFPDSTTPREHSRSAPPLSTLTPHPAAGQVEDGARANDAPPAAPVQAQGGDLGRPAHSRARTVWGVVLCTLVSVALLAVVLKLIHGGELNELGRRAAAGGVLVFLLVFVAWTLTTMPAIPLMIASGALFGPWLGALYSLAGGMLGLSLSFWIGRLLGEHRFDALVSRHPTIARAARWVETRPLAVIALMRLAPVFPVTVLNYGIGASPMSFGMYFWVSFAMTVPGAALYAGLGDVIFLWWSRRSLAVSTVVVLATALVVAGGTAWWMHRQRRRAMESEGAGAEHGAR